MKSTNFVYGRYSLILIVILHENNLNGSSQSKTQTAMQTADQGKNAD